MTDKNYKYTIDKIVELFKFIWQHRHGNKNIRAFRIYLAACGLSFAGYAYSIYANSKGEWEVSFSIGQIGLFELLIVVIFTITFFAVLFMLNKSDFEEVEKSRLKRIEEEQFLHRINPIKSFADFDKFNNTHSVSQYVDTAELKAKREMIANYDKGHIRLLGLSGTGKTFLLQKAFNEIDNESKVFYCDSIVHSDLRSSVQTLCTKHSGSTLILDNCPKDIFSDMISSFGTSIRFISAYYDPNDYSRGFLYNVISMDGLEIETIINNIIDQNVEKDISSEQKSLIAYHSGGIPFMALLLVQAFNKTSRIGTIDDEMLITHLLDIQGKYPQEQRTAMCTLALCQPLNFSNGNSEMAEYLMNSNLFTPIVNTQLDRKMIFSNVVRKLTERSLIEHDSVFINMRPQPLAIWLVGEWIKEQGSGLMDTINELSQQPSNLRVNILEAWAKRLEFMQGNQDAEKLYAELMKIDDGPFASEDMVCSDFGSRLILAMSTVNPVAASECLYAVLFPKPVKWLHAKLNNDARRNVVRALEKLCFCKESFHKSTYLVARLAIAENEEWANNSRGQFLQLFHIALAGTECDLRGRYEVLRELYIHGKEYHPLILSAIKGAFAYQGFTRMGGAEKFGFKELQDFLPTLSDIDEYWNNLYTFLVEWMDADDSVIPAVADIVVTNTRMFVRANQTKLLFRFLKELSLRLNNNWNAMHKALIETKNFDLLTPKDGEILLEWIERLTPSDILGRMQAAIHELHTKGKIGTDIIKQEEQIILPYVTEFISMKAYLGEEMITLLTDNNSYISWTFTSNLAKQLSVEAIPDMNDYILTYILRQEKNFYSSFVVNLYGAISTPDIIKPFIDRLYEEKFVMLALPIMAVTDDAERHTLQFAISQIKEGILTDDDIRRYFRAIRLTSSDEILMIAELLKNSEATSANQQLQFDFLSQYWYFDGLYSNTSLLDVYKEILLNYPLDKTTHYNYEYTRQVIGVLSKNNEVEFAKKINKKLIEFLSSSMSHFKVEEIYSVLLTKYRGAVWKDFTEALTDFDNRPSFLMQVRYEIGSGFEFGEKSLFAGHEEDMKQLCVDYPKYGPMICASMCPVFDSADSTTGEIQAFHPFAVWLIENYGDRQYVLDEFHSNMFTFHWTGGTLSLLEDRKRSLENLSLSPNLSDKIREWIKSCLDENKADYDRESQREAYLNLTYRK